MNVCKPGPYVSHGVIDVIKRTWVKKHLSVDVTLQLISRFECDSILGACKMLVVKETTYFLIESKLLILVIDIVYEAIISKIEGFY